MWSAPSLVRDARVILGLEKERQVPLGANTCRIQRLGDGFDGNAWVGGHPVSRREENHFSYVTVSADPDRNRPSA